MQLMARSADSLRAHSRPLRALALGERVFLQMTMISTG